MADVPMGNAVDDHTDGVSASDEFTLEERIQQLCDIDQKLVQLLDCTAKAMAALGPQPTSVSQDDQEASFKSSTELFLETLHTLYVKMKRQIRALEEAGVIRLRQPDKVVGEDAKITTKPSLEPNGVGSIGTLDVGWLNSRNSKVERDMEAGLWSSMKDFLEKYQDPPEDAKMSS